MNEKVEKQRIKIQAEKYHGLIVDVAASLKMSEVTVSNQFKPGYKITKATKKIISKALTLITEFNQA